MSRPILIAASKRQFEQFLKDQNVEYSSLNEAEKFNASKQFLNEKYPGLKYAPYKLVELMAVPEIDKGALTRTMHQSADAECKDQDFCIGEAISS